MSALREVDAESQQKLFPDSAFMNINHLGLSNKSRFDCKQTCVLDLAKRNILIGIEELHVSPGRAQDAFFSHITTHNALYNCHDSVPNAC